MKGLQPSAPVLPENVSGAAKGLRDTREQQIQLKRQATAYGRQDADAGDSSPGTNAETPSPTSSADTNPAMRAQLVEKALH